MGSGDVEMKKKDVNYRIITGMHAVGKQCRDCDNSDTSSTICLVVDGKIKPSGSCNQFSRHYDDVPVKVDNGKEFGYENESSELLAIAGEIDRMLQAYPARKALRIVDICKVLVTERYSVRP